MKCWDAPSEEIVLIDVLVKQLKLDLLTRKLGQNHLKSHKYCMKSNLKLNNSTRCEEGIYCMYEAYLIKFIPGRIEVLFDGVAAECDTSHTDLNIRVALPLHHAPHEVVLGYQALGLHQMDS